MKSVEMKIRLLIQKDWQIWKNFRLEALKNSPNNFSSSYEEELKWSDSKFQDILNTSDIFAAFIDNMVIGCAGFYRLNSLETKHQGIVWGIYVQPEYRGKGIASSLIEPLITHAKQHVKQLDLTCFTNNVGAIKLYQKYGFKIHSTEPRECKVDDVVIDEHLMILDLTGNASILQDGEAIQDY